MQQFLFPITPIAHPASALVQLEEALERRTEIYSREKLPGVWRRIDKLNGSHRIPPECLAGRRIFRTVLATIYWFLGVFALFPGLMLPEDLPYLLPAGVCAMVIAVFILFRRHKGVLGGLSLATGTAAMILAHGGIEGASRFFVSGVLLLLLGVIALVFCKRTGKNRFTKEAKRILNTRVKIAPEQMASFCFSGEMMTLSIGNAEPMTILYSSLKAVLETADLLLLLFQDDRALLLQKQELTWGSVAELLTFLEQYATIIRKPS